MTRSPESIRWLQDTLRSQGAKIIEIDVPNPDVMYHWAYPGLVIMRKLGMADGGYENYYRLENELQSRWALQNRINRLVDVAHRWTEYRGDFQVPLWRLYLDTDDIPVSLVIMTAARGASLGDREWLQASGAEPGEQIRPKEFADADEAMDYLIRRGVIDPDILQYFPDMDATATLGQVQSVMGTLFSVLMEGSWRQ